MHFDALTLACVTDELRRTLVGGRVQQILLVDEFSLGLEIYAPPRRLQLLISAQPAAARVHLTTYKLRRGVDEQSPLLLLLRKYARGSRLDAADQPDPTERVLRLRFDHPEHGPVVLVCELIGRQANLLLLRPGERILDALRRSPGGERILLPGRPYTPPSRPPRLPPLDDGTSDYYSRLAALVEQDGKLWQALASGIAGMSPTLAREAAARTAGAADAPARGAPIVALAHALQSLWSPVQSGAWTPGVWRQNGCCVGFSAFAAQTAPEFIPTGAMSAAIEEYHGGENRPQADPYAAQRRAVSAQLARAARLVQRRLDALAGDEPAPGEIERLRTEAAWLLAFAGQILPGQKVLEVETDAGALRIALDPQRTPVAQAQRSYARAAKLARAANFIPTRRAELRADQEFIAQLQSDLALAENQPEIAAVRDELARAGLLSTSQKQARAPRSPAAGHPRRFESRQGFEILVGRNARQNELVTFTMGRPDDLWLHARGVPGAHVVIRRRSRAVDDLTLRDAAQLAAYYSAARGERAAIVAFTECRFVSRIPGGRTGQVTVRSERTLVVPGDLPGDVVQREE